MVVQVISIYFLPLLYGTLGASVYVLRRFITQRYDRKPVVLPVVLEV